MKKLLLSIAVFVVSVSAIAQKSVINDPNASPRTISGSFNKIKISGGIDLYLSQYESESVAVSATTEKFRDNIKTVVENNTLKIYYDGGKNWVSGDKKLKAYVSFKTLEKLEASGACDVQVAGAITSRSLEIDFSGASDFKGAVEVEDLTIDLNGASDARISGKAKNLSVQSTGASDVKGYDLVTETCTAKASGASDINITVNKEISAHASGASDISYRGNAVIKDKQASGASSVSKRG